MTILICDICGTSYPDTEEKCPTCGYSRALLTETPYSDYTHAPRVKVRGGRYSKKNVRIRMEQLEQEAEKHRNEEALKRDEAVSVMTPAKDVEAAPAAEETAPEKPQPEQNTAPAPEPDDVTVRIPEAAPEESPEETACQEESEKQKANLKAYRRDVSLNLLLFFAVTLFLLSVSYLMVNYGIPFIRSFTWSTAAAFQAEATADATTGESVEVMLDDELTMSFALQTVQPETDGLPLTDAAWIGTSAVPAVHT